MRLVTGPRLRQRISNELRIPPWRLFPHDEQRPPPRRRLRWWWGHVGSFWLRYIRRQFWPRYIPRIIVNSAGASAQLWDRLVWQRHLQRRYK